MIDKLQMYSSNGKSVKWLEGLTIEDIDIEHIAHSLSLQCRFNGHTPKMYSVAQHSVLCANIAEEYSFRPEESLRVLLHDAHEAYIGDITRPVRVILNLNLLSIIRQLDSLILWKYGVAYTPYIDFIDNQALKVELNKFFGEKNKIEIPLSEGFPLWTSSLAEKMFLDRFHNLNDSIKKII